MRTGLNVVSLCFSLMAIAFSVMALCGGKHGAIATDSSGVLTLIGVCATLIVGLSVVDALSIRNLEKKVDELDSIGTEIEKLKGHINIALHVSWGMAYLNWQPSSALSEFWKGFELAIRQDDALKAHTCMKCMEKARDKINNDKTSLTDIRQIPKEVPEEVKKIKLYRVFKDRVEKVFKDVTQ